MTTSPMQYLDKAMNALHDMGLVPDGGAGEEAPIIVLLNLISDLDEERVAAIARTLDKASLFNDVVREQVQAVAHPHRWVFPPPSGHLGRRVRVRALSDLTRNESVSRHSRASRRT